jgi:hypothetical protein
MKPPKGKPPREPGTVHQQAAMVRFRRYTVACVFMVAGVVCIALGGILPRSYETSLITKYR